MRWPRFPAANSTARLRPARIIVTPAVEWFRVRAHYRRAHAHVTRLRCLLPRNDPVEIRELHSGQKVTVSEDDVFDYIHTFPDGREEGNTTGPIVAKLEQ